MNVVLVIAFHIYSFNFVQFCLKRNIEEFYLQDFNVCVLQETNLRKKYLNHHNPNVTPLSVTAVCEEIYVGSCLWLQSLLLR